MHTTGVLIRVGGKARISHDPIPTFARSKVQSSKWIGCITILPIPGC